MSKIKANRRKTVRAAKRARAEEARQAFWGDSSTPFAIGWFCTDPRCVEGIHHLEPDSDEPATRTRKAPAGKRGPSSDSSECSSEGATSGHGTESRT